MLPVRRKLWIGRGARPQSKSIVMLGRNHNVLSAGIAKILCPSFRIPFLNVFIKGRGEVVVVVVRTVMLAMVGLRGRTIETHGVQVPFGIGIVADVVLRGEVVRGMHQWR